MNSACLGRKKWAYVDGRWYRLRDVGGRPVSQPRLRQMDMEQSLVLQRCFLNLVSFCPEIASQKARSQSCQARRKVAMKRRSGSLPGEASL